MTIHPDWLDWARPAALWLFVPFALLWPIRRASSPGSVADGGDATPSPWGRVIDASLLPALLAGPQPGGAASRAPCRVCLAMALACLILALAGPSIPTTRGDPAPALRPDRARVVLVDLSPAFDALPEPTRDRLRTDLRRFLRALPAGETALAVVAGAAWLVVPPTEDLAVLDVFVGELASAAVPVPGDQPDAGLALARKTLEATGRRYQDVYWLRVDSNRAAPRSMAPSFPRIHVLAAEARVEEWLAGIAPRSEAPVSLEAIGGVAGGPSRLDLGPILIILTLPLLVAGRSAAIRGAPALAAFAVIAACCPTDSWAAAPSSKDAVALYRAGRFDEAAAAFASAGVDDPRALHNRGNALARAGRLREALEAYDASLRLRPENTDTRFNRDLVARLFSASGHGPPPPNRPPSPDAAKSDEARRAFDQWLRRAAPPPPGLLARKLALEDARQRRAQAR